VALTLVEAFPSNFLSLGLDKSVILRLATNNAALSEDIPRRTFQDRKPCSRKNHVTMKPPINIFKAVRVCQKPSQR